MKVILFGASGMVGQGVLRECLLDPDITEVLALVRSPLGRADSKLREIVHGDFYDFTAIEASLRGYDACFFCLGVSALGMTEEAYWRVTHDLALGAARTLARLNPDMVFEYISGAGTDRTEKGRVMWARVKGATENAIAALKFKAVFLLRPGFIQPLHGIRSKTPLYRFFYALLRPLTPLLARLAPHTMTTTERLGRAMIRLAKTGGPGRVVEMRELNWLG